MYSVVGRAALRAPRRHITSAIRPRFAHQDAGAQEAGKDALAKGAKRDPELYVLFAIMSGVFGLAGWHFSRNPTSSGSEQKVAIKPHSEPWKTGRSSVYQYHPGGDTSLEPKDAPSALNSVIVPNVNLPKSLHEQYNKYGKEGY